MKIDIEALTEAELIDLNHKIVERLRFLEQTRAHRRMLDFAIGDRVMFAPDAGTPVAGTLMRYNKKTVTVISDSGQHWNVSPGLLRKAPPAHAEPASSNVIALKPK